MSYRPTPEHLQAMRRGRYGDMTREERFWSRVDRSDPGSCWMWVGKLDRHGYGTYTTTGPRTVLPHRYAFELIRGPIPAGLTLDHLCREPRCVNPVHLEPVTVAENTRRQKADTPKAEACRFGHPFTPENAWFSASGRKRECRACRRERRRAAKAA